MSHDIPHSNPNNNYFKDLAEAIVADRVCETFSEHATASDVVNEVAIQHAARNSAIYKKYSHIAQVFNDYDHTPTNVSEQYTMGLHLALNVLDTTCAVNGIPIDDFYRYYDTLQTPADDEIYDFSGLSPQQVLDTFKDILTTSGGQKFESLPGIFRGIVGLVIPDRQDEAEQSQLTTGTYGTVLSGGLYAIRSYLADKEADSIIDRVDMDGEIRALLS